jgi:hypothetical protein
MMKPEEEAIAQWESQRDLNAELEASIDDVQAGRVVAYVVYKTDGGGLAELSARED